ncbi:cytochrome c family protein [Niveispirillum sp. BGYR6]|uniref:c-type cytochrome n=1 Tax=Niveispirillum sp. BGYR6 TaxID=2971249 RepID=UPI0022B98843|nr:cytochrome c family protein [Niveispirillum sp. BGYR6]MDG5493293.1 cytochrome c family protein [Niveispirillum sp. BGYR6]
MAAARANDHPEGNRVPETHIRYGRSLMSKFLAFACGLALVLMPSIAPAQEGDAAAGKLVFNKCMACHNVENDKPKVGPSLMGLFGRQPGTVSGFTYSKAMVDFGAGKTWDEALLKSYLPNPKNLVNGTKMAFPGLKTDKEIADVIAYLKQFSPGK